MFQILFLTVSCFHFYLAYYTFGIKPAQLLFCFSVRHNIQHFAALQPFQFLSLPLFPLFYPHLLSHWHLTSSFAYHRLRFSFSLLPRLWLPLSSAAAAAAAAESSLLIPSSSQHCPPSAFPSRAHQRLYGPLSYQLHCGISRLSGLSSGELSVPPSSLCWLLGGQPLSTLFFFFCL